MNLFKSLALALAVSAVAATAPAAFASESPVNLLEGGVDHTNASESYKAAHEFDTPLQNPWNQN